MTDGNSAFLPALKLQHEPVKFSTLPIIEEIRNTSCTSCLTCTGKDHSDLYYDGLSKFEIPEHSTLLCSLWELGSG